MRWPLMSYPYQVDNLSPILMQETPNKTSGPHREKNKDKRAEGALVGKKEVWAGESTTGMKMTDVIIHTSETVKE